MYIFTGFADEIDPNPEVQLSLFGKMGVKFLEFRSAWGRNVLDLLDNELDEFKHLLSENGIGVSSIGSPIGKTYIEDDFQIEKRRFRRAVDIAHMFSSPFIRIFSFYSRNNILDEKEEVLDRLGVLSEIAKEEGLILLHENETGIYGESAERTMDIVEALSGSSFGLVFDPANFAFAGYDVKKALDTLYPYIKYIHVKDYSISEKKMVIAGQGDSELCMLFDKMRDPDLFISMEPHLDIAGQFGGFTGSEGFEEYILAVRTLLDKLGIAWE